VSLMVGDEGQISNFWEDISSFLESVCERA
jgi:hypothetical protein